MRDRLDCRMLFNLEESWKKAKKVMESLNIAEENTINDIVEYVHILRLMDNLKTISDEWKQRVDEFSSYKKKLQALIGKFFASLDDQNCKQIYEELERAYKEDFWKLFEQYRTYKRISVSVFEDILMNSSGNIYLILECKQLVQYYSDAIKKYFMNFDDSAKILLDKYEMSPKKEKNIYIPDLSKEEINKIFMNYIESAYAHINMLEAIANIRPNADLPLTNKVKLAAKRKTEELIKAVIDGKRGFKVDHRICVSFRDNTEPLDEEKKGECKYFIYDRKWVRGNLDNATILNNFIYLLGYADTQMRLQVVSKELEATTLEKTFRLRSKNDYLESDVFHFKMGLSYTQMVAYYQELLENDIRLEDVIEWFFKDYVKEEFGINGFSMKMPSETTTYLEKCRTLIPEMESILKQFKLYVEEGEIDAELLQIASGATDITQIPSCVKGKYVYGIGKDFRRMETDLFSDQCMLHWVERLQGNYKAFFDLILRNDVKKEDYKQYLWPELEWLKENGIIIYDAEGYIRFGDLGKVSIIADLAKNETISFYHYPIAMRAKFSELKDQNLIEYEDSLFSRPEQNWLSYMLNKSKYNNGLDIRNKYAHGTQAPSNEDHIHRQYYFYILSILIMYMIKINDDLDIFFKGQKR